MFNAKLVPHYPKDVAGCSVINVLPLVEELDEKLMMEVPKTTCDLEVYGFQCIWNEEIAEGFEKVGLLNELLAFVLLKGEQVCEELNLEDEKDEACCLIKENVVIVYLSYLKSLLLNMRIKNRALVRRFWTLSSLK